MDDRLAIDLCDRRRELDRKDTPVLGTGGPLGADLEPAGLGDPRPRAREDRPELVAVLGRHDQVRQRSADRLAGGVSERRLGGPVPAGDDTGRVGRDIRLVHQVEDHLPLGRLLGELAALADVLEDGDDADGLAPFAERRRPDRVRLVAVLGRVLELALLAGESGAVVVDQGRGLRRARQQVLDPAADDLLAVERPALPVRGPDPEVGVDQDDRQVRELVEQLQVALLAAVAATDEQDRCEGSRERRDDRDLEAVRYVHQVLSTIPGPVGPAHVSAIGSGAAILDRDERRRRAQMAIWMIDSSSRRRRSARRQRDRARSRSPRAPCRARCRGP